MGNAYPEGFLLYADETADRESAEKLAGKLNIPLTDSLPEDDRLMLRLTGEGLSLTGDGLSFKGDLTGMKKRLKGGVLMHEMLLRAARIKNRDHDLRAVDATAGMGEDSLILAAGGFNVILFEYNPVIAALLEDTLRRAGDVPELAPIVSRMTVVQGDSTILMPQITEDIDVVLLDPMFPARSKSALIKKKFQLLQQLESPCSSEEELLDAAIAVHPHKIVIKRPLKGPYLAGRKPAYSLNGKAIRYDCHVFAGEPE